MKRKQELLRVIAKGSLPLLLVMAASVALVPLIQTTLIQSTQKLVDLITAMAAFETVLAILALIGGLKFSSIVFDFIRKAIIARFNARNQQKLQLYVINQLQPSFITKAETPDYQNRVQLVMGSLSQVQQLALIAFEFIQQAILVISYFYLTVRVSWVIAVVVLVLQIPNAIYALKLAVAREKHAEHTIEWDRKSGVYLDLLTSSHALKERLVFGIKSFLSTKWLLASTEGIELRLRFQFKDSSIQSLLQVLQAISYIIVQILAVQFILSKQMTIGEYVAINMTIGMIEASLTALCHQFSMLRQFRIVRKRLFSLFEYVNSSETNKKSIMTVQHIRCDNLSFTYPNRPAPTIRNVNLEIPLGTTLVIVGENGCGKSTLGKILTGLHKVDEQQLYFDNHDIHEVLPESIHNNMSVVTQEYIRYPFSTNENIALSDLDEIESAKIQKLLSVFPMLVHPSLQESMDTLLGNQFTGSVELSGGQWQRIAVARALYHDRPILLLDEATASLDPETEIDLMNRILNYRGGKTTIIITHRLSVTKQADLILVMDQGSIVESGTYAELMETRGTFHRMWNSQMNVEEGGFPHEQVSVIV